MEVDRSEASYSKLLEQFELTKKELGDAEDNIKRLTGRDPDKFEIMKGQPGLNKRRLQPPLFPDKPFNGRKRPLFPIIKDEDEVPPEESPDEDESPVKKPSLLSTVVASAKDIKSRKDVIQEQNVNSKVKARNRRMFGMILGTLQKFQHDAKKSEEKEKKRAEIEQKVEAAAAEEKERIKREKEELFQFRREKQAELRCLEKKLEIAELHEAWERNEKHMVNFIRTKCEPSICYLPATHNQKTAKCLEMSRKKTLERIQERREKMEKDLLEVEEMYKKSNFPSDKENIGPLEEEDNLNELTDSQEPQVHQDMPEVKTEESQDIPPSVPDNHLESKNLHETRQKTHDYENLALELQKYHRASPEKVHSPSIETDNKIKNETVESSENIETKNNGKTDQDFEPIYD